MKTRRALVPAAGAALLAIVLSVGGCSPSPSVPDGSGPDPAAPEDEQVASSTDLETWEVLPEDALPELPSWIIPGKTWAPEVTEVSPGSFAMYFTATNFRPSVQCIGVATAADPLGPFVVQGAGMLVCPADVGGAIDASTFVDADGSLYLVWKNDGNCCGFDTWLNATRLSPDGLTLAGETIPLFKQTEDWEGQLVEAPTLLVRDDSYVMLYSANSYSADLYAIGYASAPALQGPWTKDDEPWLSTESSGDRIIGPGGQDLVEGPDGDTHLVLHGWDGSFSVRRMYVLPVEWDGDVPSPVLE